MEKMKENNDVHEIENRAFHKLEEESWKYDAAPEIFEGENVADYYSYENKEKLEALLAEDDQLKLEFDKLKNDLSKEIFDKEYEELRDKEKKEVYDMAIAKANRIITKSKKGKRMPKAKLVAIKEKVRKIKKNGAFQT